MASLNLEEGPGGREESERQQVALTMYMRTNEGKLLAARATVRRLGDGQLL